MTLLTPIALFGLVLLAIPILVHLFQPRRVRQTPFSSLRWLHLAQQRLARRIKWHQILLFLLRAAFISLLVFALARPQFSAGGADGRVDRFIVLDVSRSMGYATPGRDSPMTSARAYAGELIKRSGAADRTALLLAGASTTVLAPLAHDAEAALPELERINAGASDTNLGSALPVIRSMLGQRDSEDPVEVIVLTDHHQGSWHANDIRSFAAEIKAPTRVRIVDFSVPSPQNAWIADAQVITMPESGRKALRVDVACVGDVAQERKVKVSGLGGEPTVEAIEVSPGRPRRLHFNVSNISRDDGIARVQLEPADSLPGDDALDVDLVRSGAMRVLLIDPDSTQGPGMRPTLHIQAAAEALSAMNQNIEATNVMIGDLKTSAVEDADVIVMGDIGEISDAMLETIERRVRAGGGLALFLGPSIKPETFNAKFHKPLHASESLSPLPLGALSRPAGRSLTPLQDVAWDHPLFTGLSDPSVGDFGIASLRQFYKFDSKPGEGDRVLARVDGETPAVIEHPLGAGRVLFFNATANDQWWDMPRRNAFVPIIDRILAYLGGGERTRTFIAGQTVSMSVPKVQDESTIRIIAPNKQELTPAIQPAGGRTVFRLDQVTQTGVYRVTGVGGDDDSLRFVVRAGPADSAITPIDVDAVKQWWDPLTFEVISSEPQRRDLLAASTRLALWPWLLGLGCVVLLAEMYFVHKLCPRMNPVVVAPMVRHARSAPAGDAAVEPDIDQTPVKAETAG